MNDNEMLAALAAKYPGLKRTIAEYTGDGKAAIDAYLREQPTEAVAFIAELVEMVRDGTR